MAGQEGRELHAAGKAAGGGPGGAAPTAGYAQKEALLRAEMEQLSHAESRTLALRIRQASADDPLTAPLQRWTAERRGRIIDFLEDSRRREALRREAELRSKPR
ncbi:MAG: hypothetical protein KIT31_38285 [Deltaproteobacteria bacterium]|nr:hypothetical protein [Deltaproteobacteria bacterium]